MNIPRYCREGSVVENQELTKIFIKYMHDIVLKISFLDVISKNWNRGGHWKLWQEMVKIQERCQQTSNIPTRGWRAWKNWFFMSATFLAWGIFSIHQIKKKVKKKARAKKIFVSKNQFCQAHQPCKGIFEIFIVFSNFSARASNGSHYSNFENWCLKMKSWGLYHAYILWKSGLILDFQEPNLY